MLLCADNVKLPETLIWQSYIFKSGNLRISVQTWCMTFYRKTIHQFNISSIQHFVKNKKCQMYILSNMTPGHYLLFLFNYMATSPPLLKLHETQTISYCWNANLYATNPKAVWVIKIRVTNQQNSSLIIEMCSLTYQ